MDEYEVTKKKNTTERLKAVGSILKSVVEILKARKLITFLVTVAMSGIGGSSYLYMDAEQKEEQVKALARSMYEASQHTKTKNTVIKCPDCGKAKSESISECKKLIDAHIHGDLH